MSCMTMSVIFMASCLGFAAFFHHVKLYGFERWQIIGAIAWGVIAIICQIKGW